MILMVKKLLEHLNGKQIMETSCKEQTKKNLEYKK